MNIVDSGNTTGTHTVFTVDGNVDSIFFLESRNGFGGTVGGRLRSLKTKIFDGSWTVGTLDFAHFKTAGVKTPTQTFNTAAILSTADFDAKKLAIGRVLIEGSADEFSVQTNGNVGSISALDMTDHSTVMIGIKEANIDTLVNSPDQYLAHATLGSLTLHRARPITFSSSLVAAWHIGQITIGTIALQNVGVPFGLAANSIDSLSARGDNGENLSFQKLDDPAALQREISRRGLAMGDFHIVLV